MTLNLSLIDDNKLRKELEDIICNCDDCDINGYCDCDYPCRSRLTEDKISEIIIKSRVTLSVESDGEKVTFG